MSSFYEDDLDSVGPLAVSARLWIKSTRGVVWRPGLSQSRPSGHPVHKHIHVCSARARR